MVCNYSLYGYNYKDYLSERTPTERLNTIYKNLDYKKVAEDKSEDSVWLKGIFHKNDGYQTPIVLYPLRSEGALDVHRENELAKERILSMLFYKDRSGAYPLRTINDTLNVETIVYTPLECYATRYEWLQVLKIKSTQNLHKNYDAACDIIQSFWEDKLCLHDYQNKPLYKEAIDYIVYKTIKIAQVYPQYRSLKKELRKGVLDYEGLIKELQPLLKDDSHRTRKIYRTINYLRFDIYDVGNQINRLDELSLLFDDIIGRTQSNDSNVSVDLLLPPPVLKVDLGLRKNANGSTITLSQLSSGEKQVTYTISNFLYHLVNIDSSWHARGGREVVRYRYVTAIFDEVELYFHPELQRVFISQLLGSLKSIKLYGLKGLNIIFVTHSPFMLSDIPMCNVLTLGENEEDSLQTFGGNINEILDTSFFLKSSVGEFAKEQISYIADLHERCGDGENIVSEYHQNAFRIKYVSQNIGDRILRRIVDEMVRDIQKSVTQHEKRYV